MNRNKPTLHSQTDPSRRGFMQASAPGIATAALAHTEANAARLTNAEGIPMRPLGKTGEMVTMICLGGYHSSVHPNESDSIRLIQRAVDEGITFLDNAWDYHDGAAEERMGKAISQGNRRDKVFLMTKCCGRTAKDAQSHLEDSLRRCAPTTSTSGSSTRSSTTTTPTGSSPQDGAIQTALKAKEQGKIRYLGFHRP